MDLFAMTLLDLKSAGTWEDAAFTLRLKNHSLKKCFHNDQIQFKEPIYLTAARFDSGVQH